jgi:hypothetical protein
LLDCEMCPTRSSGLVDRSFVPGIVHSIRVYAAEACAGSVSRSALAR